METETNWIEFFEDRERLYAEYYLDFAQQNARRDPEAYEQLEAESGNLLRVADWLAEQNEAEGILRLASALWEESDFMRSRGFMQRGLPLLEHAHQSARQIEDLEAEFIWLEALANVHHETGNPELAQPLFEEALKLAQGLNNLQFKAKARLGIGRVLMEKGQLSRAASWLKQALQNYRQTQEHTGEIETLTALGTLLSLQRDFAGAESYLEQGLSIAQARQDRQGEAALRNALGYAATLAQDWLKAIKHYEAVIEVARAIGDYFFEVRGLHNLGEAWLELGDVQQAVNLLEEALTRQETIDDVLTKAFTHFCLGKAYNILNAPDKSLVQLKEVYPFRQVPVLLPLAVEAAWIRADNYLKQSKIDLARTALQNVLGLAPHHMAEIRRAAGELLESLEKGEYECELGLTIKKQMRDK